MSKAGLNVTLKSGRWVTHIGKKKDYKGFSWIDHYKTISGSNSPKCCVKKNQVLSRNNKKPGTCNGVISGAHVVIGKKGTGKQYIVPTCTYHNDAMKSFFLKGDSFTVNKTTAIRALKGLTKNQQKSKSDTKLPRSAKGICNAIQDNKKRCTRKLHGRYRVNCGKHQHPRFR